MALIVHADCLFWELCFIMFAIFPFPHMIAIFLPCSIYLAIPPIPKIAQKEALHPGSGLLFTVIPERPFVIIMLRRPKQLLSVLGLIWENGIGRGIGSSPNFHP